MDNKKRLWDWLGAISTGLCLLFLGSLIAFHNETIRMNVLQKKNDEHISYQIRKIESQIKIATSERVMMKLDSVEFKINQKHMMKQLDKIINKIFAP